MILVDTNVIIDYWNDPDEKITEIFEREDIAICGIVEAELLHGARSDKEIKEIEDAISCFEKIPIGEYWDELGTMLYKLRTNGVTLPLADAIIAQVAIRNSISVLTNDNHFNLIKAVIPALSLYEI